MLPRPYRKRRSPQAAIDVLSWGLLPLLRDPALIADDARPDRPASREGALRAGPNIGCRLKNNSKTRILAFANPQRYSSSKVVEMAEAHIFYGLLGSCTRKNRARPESQ